MLDNIPYSLTIHYITPIYTLHYYITPCYRNQPGAPAGHVPFALERVEGQGRSHGQGQHKSLHNRGHIVTSHCRNAIVLITNRHDIIYIYIYMYVCIYN